MRIGGWGVVIWARVLAEGRDGLAVEPLVGLNVLCGRVVWRIAPHIDLALPDANVVNVKERWPVLSVDGGDSAVPGADGGVHDDRHGLVGDLTLRRPLAALVPSAPLADRILFECARLHRPDELVVVIPREAAVGPGLPLHPVGPVRSVQIVQLRQPARERVGAAREAF